MSEEVTYIDLDGLRECARNDNESLIDMELEDVFEGLDISYEALKVFGFAGVQGYLEKVETGEMDPVQALMGMWFGGVKMGVLIRDEQRRRIVSEFGTLSVPNDASELTRENPEVDGDGA